MYYTIMPSVPKMKILLQVVWSKIFKYPNVHIYFTEKYAINRHFTVVCLVTWPMNESETGVDLVLIEISLLFLCKFLLNC